jgi:predicted ATPase/DNA-binding SARP family transcriptional activator
VVDFSVLGPLQVTVAGRAVPLRRGLPRALLILLLVRRRMPTSPEAIVDRLWSGDPPADRGNAVHRVVAYLRRTLGPEGRALLVRQDSGYALLAGDEAVDAVRFDALVRRALAAGVDPTATGGGPPAAGTPATTAAAALGHLDAALALWRGEPLADVADHEWAAAEIARLTETYLQAHEARLACLLALGRHREVVTEARALIAAHPLREQMHAHLMVALYRGERQGEALEAYASARRLLASELGLDPGPQLQELERRILAHDRGLRWAAPTRPGPTAGPQTAAVVAAPAPAAPPTSLVGREKDLDDLDDLLDRTRLLTLTGPGGAGKTRLAVELNTRHRGHPSWFVDLSVLGNDALVVPTVAQAVGAVVGPGDDPVEAVVAKIGDSTGMLLLDNCEHVVETAGALASRLLRSCPGLTQVATSRRPLRVVGEVTWPVPPLRLPPAGATAAQEVRDSPAAQLFAVRAAAVRPDFAVRDANAADVAAIVRCLDGLPLAIELAAAHADVLGTAAIRRRLADHFDLLETDMRDTPARQRTLRAVIDSSVALLTDAEKRFFVQLGVFAGSFDLEAAGAVTAGPPADAYRLTASLVRQSLVVTTPTGRYRLLESLRAYAAQALSGDPDEHAVRQRHLEHLIAIMTRADHEIRTDAQEECLAWVRETLPDLRAALRWSLGGAAPGRGALLTAVSTWFWTLEGMLVEARQWLDAADAVAVLDDAVRAALRLAVGRIAAPLGELVRARDACAESVEISRRLGDDRMVGAALVTLGIAQWALGDLARAAASHDEAVARLTATGDVWNRTAALVLRARTAIDAGEADVDDRIDAAVAAARQGREKHLIGLAASQRARRALLVGDTRTAYDTAGTCLTVWRQVGYQEGEISALNLLARAAAALDRPEQAEELVRESLRVAATIAHRGGLCEGLECLAAAFHATGRDEQALHVLAVVEAERRRWDMPTPAADAGRLAHMAAQIRHRLGPSADVALAGATRTTVDELLERLALKR